MYADKTASCEQLLRRPTAFVDFILFMLFKGYVGVPAKQKQSKYYSCQ